MNDDWALSSDTVALREEERRHRNRGEEIPAPKAGASKVTVRVENNYEDGHHSERVVEVDAPKGDIDEWSNTVLFDVTGDGHGIGRPSLGSCYTVTILAAEDRTLVGEEWEWID